jgi:hypothetical protein
MTNNNTLQLVTFEQAKRLKEIGFEWPVNHCFGTHPENSYWEESGVEGNQNVWKNRVSRPSIQLALKWFREVKGLHGWVETTYYLGRFQFDFCVATNTYPVERFAHIDGKMILSHDQAEAALLSHLLEIAG